jgi:hypothetical protein
MQLIAVVLYYVAILSEISLKFIKERKENAQKHNTAGDEEYYEEVWVEQESEKK